MLRQLSALCVLTTALCAQSPLTTLYAWNNGGAAGWTMYFDLDVNLPVTITQIDTNSGSGASVAGSLDVYYTTTATTYVGNDTNVGAWTLGGSGPCVSAALNVPTTCTITPFTLPPGTYGIAIVHNGIAPYYTDGTGTAVPGSGANQTYSNVELTLRAGASGGGGLGTAICCTPRVFNGSIHYVAAGGGTVAQRTPYGTGCYQRVGSFYELFATSAAFDLSNTAITMLPSGFGYIALPGVTTYVPPSAAATALSLTDDSETTVALASPFPLSSGSTSSLTVCSNGYVSAASGNGVGYTPVAASLLNGPQTGWWNQHDYNPTILGSGQVKFEQAGGIAYVTWDGVWDFGGASAANANTFQFQFDTASGAVHVVFQTMSALGNGRLVGYSPGGPSGDPGSIDLSAALPLTLNLPIESPLALAASARPLIGTSINLVTSNATGLNVGLNFLSLVQIPAPGFDLGVIGAPGCPGLVDVNAGVGNVISNLGLPGLGMSVTLPIPNNTGLLGAAIYSQSAWLDASANAFGVLTSNGVALVLGNL